MEFLPHLSKIVCVRVCVCVCVRERERERQTEREKRIYNHHVGTMNRPNCMRIIMFYSFAKHKKVFSQAI